MPSTFSPLKIQLMATGENNTTWGDVTNLNLGTALEEAIVGSADVTFASADVTLTLTDTNTSQTARNMRLRCTGTTGGSTRNLIVPSIEKPYIVKNDCADSVVVKTAAGTGITVPAGKTMWVYTDATNVVDAVTHLSSLTLGTDLAVSDGGTGASTFTANGVIYGNTTSALLATAAGTTGQVLVGNTGAAPSWATLTGIGVTSFSGGTTGLTPNTATTGAITLAGTLGVANGGTGTGTAFTAGSVVFAGASGVYSQDNANFFWDNTNDRLGIGTASPGERLTVAATANSAARITSTATTTALIIDNTNANAWGSNLAIRTGGVAAGYFGTIGSLLGSTSQDITAYADTGNGFRVYTNGNNERMRIDSSGNVGIGTATPDVFGRFYTRSVGINSSGTSMLQINGTTYGGIDLGFNGTRTATMLAETGGLFIQTVTAAAMSLGTNGLERMRIDTSGNVGIGTSSPGDKLTVSGTNTGVGISGGTGSAGSPAYTNLNFRGFSSNRTAVIRSFDQSGSFAASGGLEFLVNQNMLADTLTSVMRITADLNVGIGTSAPVTRLHVSQSNSGDYASVALLSNSADAAADRTGIYGSPAPGTANPYRGGITFWPGSSGAVSIHTGNNATPGAGERVRIDGTNGNVGIGTTTPAEKLSVAGAIRVHTNSSAGFTLDTKGGLFDFVPASNNVRLGYVPGTSGVNTGILTFVVGSGSEAMRITSAGNVGIGTTAPATKLQIQETTGTSGFESGLSLTNAVDSNLFLQITGSASADKRALISTSTVTPIAFATNSVERMRIDASGNVGINSTPSAWSSGYRALQIAGQGAGLFANTTVSQAILGSNGYYNGTNWIYNNSDTAGQYWVDGNVHKWFNAAGGSSGSTISFTERMRIDSSGNLLVGTTAALSNPTTGITFLPASGASNAGIGHVTGTASGTGYLYFAFNGGNIGSITQDGTTAVLYNTSSDARLKDNINDADDAASLIDAIQVRKFDWKADGSHQRYGFVAQELVTVAPEAVSQPADPDDMMGVDYSKLVPMLVKEIQSLRARVAQLEGN